MSNSSERPLKLATTPTAEKEGTNSDRKNTWIIGNVCTGPSVYSYSYICVRLAELYTCILCCSSELRLPVGKPQKFFQLSISRTGINILYVIIRLPFLFSCSCFLSLGLLFYCKIQAQPVNHKHRLYRLNIPCHASPSQTLNSNSEQLTAASAI